MSIARGSLSQLSDFINRCIDVRGKIDLQEVTAIQSTLEKQWRIGEEPSQERFLRVLAALQDPLLRQVLEAHTDLEQKREILKALVMPLRQKVGSCFATAIAILIHEEQPLQFIRDCRELLIKKRLTRIVEGEEIIAPRVLFENLPLLHSWEYTLASFAEQRQEGCAWNLVVSLGIQGQEDDGLGQVILAFWQEKMDQIVREVDELQPEIERAFLEVQGVHARLKTADSRLEWLRSDLYAKQHHFDALIDRRDLLHEKARLYQKAPSELVQALLALIPDYFQEVFDPSLSQSDHQEDIAHPDDSTAGFRLLCKYGRPSPSAWQLIGDEKGYLGGLQQFLVASEGVLRDVEYFQPLTKELSECMAKMVHFIRSPLFIQGASRRSQQVRGSKEPWAYRSGASLETLVASLYGRKPPLTKMEKWVESAEELLVFFSDSVQSIPPNLLRRRLLATSPSHAFTLLTMEERFSALWQQRGYPYTWIKEQLVEPMRRFFRNCDFQGRETAAGLYRDLPFFPHEELLERLEKLFAHLGLSLSQVPEIPYKPFWGASALYELTVFLLQGHTFTQPTREQIVHALRTLGFAPPQPLIFADSNWSGLSRFAFLVNPLSLELELWAVDELGIDGVPMQIWKAWWNGRDRRCWTVYNHPLEYT